jgi:hypothetical protein
MKEAAGAITGGNDAGGHPNYFFNGRRRWDIRSVGTKRCEQIVKRVRLVIAQNYRGSLTG